jgi:hypothetical protein
MTRHALLPKDNVLRFVAIQAKRGVKRDRTGESSGFQEATKMSRASTMGI